MPERRSPVADDPARNEALERLLARAGWSPENLGDHLNRLAAAIGLKVHVNRRYPRRWVYAEKGRPAPRIPRDPVPSLVCLLLARRLGEPLTPAALGWATSEVLRYVHADDGLSRNWDALGTLAAVDEVMDADSMERRHFMAVTGLTLTAVAHRWLADPARVAASVTGRRTDHLVVGDLERVAEARRRLDDALGGGSLLAGVREDLRLVVALLKNSAYTGEVGRRLYAVAAEFGRLAGWLAFETMRPALAQRYFLAALRAAHLSGDRAVGANVLGFMSIQAAYSASPQDAVALAESALASGATLTPAVEGSLQARLACAKAGVGDIRGWERAQHRAFDLLVRSVPASEPPWISYFTEANAQANAGVALLALHRPSQAQAPLHRAVALVDQTYSRDRAQMLCLLATARVAAGAVEEGCATAGEAATAVRRLESPRARQFLAEFRRAAEPHAGSAAVRAFDARHRDLVGTVAAGVPVAR